MPQLSALLEDVAVMVWMKEEKLVMSDY